MDGWVRKTMGDTELADRIAETVRIGRSGQERSLRIRKLMEERLNQCRERG